MRFGSVLLAMFLVTATLAAQYQNYQYSTPYYPGQIFPSPYYPGSYYPGSYYPSSAPVYMQQQIYPDQFTSATANNIIDDLEAQVERLQGEVERLQNELAVTAVTVVSPPPPQPEAQNAEPETPATPVTVVFDNGAQVEGSGYAIAGDMIWILGPTGSRRFALSDLNLEATQRENLSRGVGFQAIPAE